MIWLLSRADLLLLVLLGVSVGWTGRIAWQQIRDGRRA